MENIDNKLSELVEKEIIRQHGTLRKFTEKFGWSYTTIYSGLKRGIGGMGIDTFNSLCKDLNIDINALLIDNVIKPMEHADMDIDYSLKAKILKMSEKQLEQLNDYVDFLLSKNEN